MSDNFIDQSQDQTKPPTCSTLLLFHQMSCVCIFYYSGKSLDQAEQTVVPVESGPASSPAFSLVLSRVS